METELQWIIRRIKVRFYSDARSFKNASKLNFVANAFYSPATDTVHISPMKDIDQLTPTFRHELVHVIFKQKYKTAIPGWLEEGLANHLGSQRKVDYKWLKKQTIPDADKLSHPTIDGSTMHYQLSTATAEMIAARCNLKDLMMLATGSKLTQYLSTFCKIKDLNNDVRRWITQS
jgi:antirestriction protein ArdC